jgi:hypothetical protein
MRSMIRSVGSSRSGFGIFDMTDPDYEEIRKIALSGDEGNLYLDLGYFISWFAVSEFRITSLLQAATTSQNTTAFDLLTKGMDARVKCERLRAACDLFLPMGSNLDTRLGVFERHIIPLPNKLAHSFVACPHPFTTMHFSSQAKLPYKAFGKEQIGDEPEQMTTLEFFKRS